MKAFVTSIGERTTKICCDQLKRFGYEVVLLDGQEPWPQKYRRFISEADEDCIRIDADIIPNTEIADIPNVIKAITEMFEGTLMVQFNTYDLYRNNVGVTSPVWYSKKALEIIREQFPNLTDLGRPEASAWRLPAIVRHTLTAPRVVGLHGFFQDYASFNRHLKHKQERHQEADYDLDLARKLTSL
jgi:hypothetical protein